MNRSFQAALEIEAIDRALGYILLCKLCNRLFLFRPPRFSWLVNVVVTDKFEEYMRENGYEVLPDDDIDLPRKPRKFSELKEFNRSEGLPPDLPRRPFKVRRVRRG